MRRTVIAATAAAVLALSAACGSDDASDMADNATQAAGDAVSSATEAAGGEGGADGEAGADGESGATGEMGTIALADGSEVEVPAGIAQKYEEIQGTSDHLGAPAGEAQEVAGGQMVEFEGGTLVQNPDGEAFLVQGVILEEYMANGGPDSELGFPTTDETPTETGFISTFDNGEITFDLSTEQATVQQN